RRVRADPSRAYFEDGAAVVHPAVLGGAIEIPCRILDQPVYRITAVISGGKAVEHGFCTVLEFKDGAAAAAAIGARAAISGRAVKGRALAVPDQAAPGIAPIACIGVKGIKHRFASIGRNFEDNTAIIVRAAFHRCSVEIAGLVDNEAAIVGVGTIVAAGKPIKQGFGAARGELEDRAVSV